MVTGEQRTEKSRQDKPPHARPLGAPLSQVGGRYIEFNVWPPSTATDGPPFRLAEAAHGDALQHLTTDLRLIRPLHPVEISDAAISAALLV